VVGEFTLFAVDINDVTYIGYDADTSGQHVARWPAGLEYVRPSVSPDQPRSAATSSPPAWRVRAHVRASTGVGVSDAQWQMTTSPGDVTGRRAAASTASAGDTRPQGGRGVRTVSASFRSLPSVLRVVFATVLSTGRCSAVRDIRYVWRRDPAVSDGCWRQADDAGTS
jgi:hypothetical protein